MIKRVFYEKDKAIGINLKNRRVNVKIKDDMVVVMSKRLINSDENLEDLKRAGFRIYRDRIAYFKYVVSVEAFDEVIQAYLYLKRRNCNDSGTI